MFNQKNENFFIAPIDSFGLNGEGIAKYHEIPILIEGTLPGELATIRLTPNPRKFEKFLPILISNPSSERVQPVCSLYGKCGGCQLMHLQYSAQLKFKQQLVIQAFDKIFDYPLPIAPCIPSPSSLHYRNKIQLPVAKGDKGLSFGLFARNSHDIVPFDECYVHCPLGEKILGKIKKILTESTITAYDEKTQLGDLRYLLIKTAVNRKQALVVFVTNGQGTSEFSARAEEILASDSHIKGVIQNINAKQGNVILAEEYKLLAGNAHIEEEMGGLSFKISAASFFQVNTEQAECLYAKALDFAQLSGEETVLDAYCGIGTLSLLIAPHVKKVIGVECIKEAVLDAQHNALLNGIHNAEFTWEKSEIFIKSLDKIDVAFINPPRKGCDIKFLKSLCHLKPAKLIYISCNPTTLARDIAELKAIYRIEAIQPFDMFPQTPHVECLVSLRLKQ